MAGIRPKQLSRLGEFYLEEVVLDVLRNKCGTRKDFFGNADVW